MKNILRTIVFGSALGVAAIAMPSTMARPFAGVQDQDHHDGGQGQPHPDYSKNRFYKVGNSEGYQDYKHKTQRKEHNHGPFRGRALFGDGRNFPQCQRGRNDLRSLKGQTK